MSGNFSLGVWPSRGTQEPVTNSDLDEAIPDHASASGADLN